MYLAIDIGGTAIKYGLIDNKLNMVEHQIISTATHNLKLEIMKQVDSIVNHYYKQCSNLVGVGISTAGVVNMQSGEIVYAGPTMPSYLGTNLKKWIEDHYHIETVVVNDVNAAAIGEKWRGVAKPYSEFICITIGTGVGGAVFINNSLHIGSHYRAGEIGHIPLGNKTNMSYEQIASMVKLLSRAKQELNFNGDGKALFDRAKAGHLETIALIDSWIKDIVSGLIPLLHILDPEAVIIGGAVSQQGDYLIDRIKCQLRNLISPSIVMPDVLAASLGNDAALYGAIYTFVAQGTGKSK